MMEHLISVLPFLAVATYMIIDRICDAIEVVKTPIVEDDVFGWLPWLGGDCPCSDWMRVDIETTAGKKFYEVPARLINWTHYGVQSDVWAYRVCEDSNCEEGE